MPPKKPHCKVCQARESKYTCAQCHIVYCSVACYKHHKDGSCKDEPTQEPKLQSESEKPTVFHVSTNAAEATPAVLRPLTSLKWPYVPEESAYPDPLKRDDPKVLQLQQYEAIATSPAIRRILGTRRNLPELLQSIDRLRGREREEALQKALGVTPSDVDGQDQPKDLGDGVLALRELAEAIEAAVRGDNDCALGLNWGE